MDKDDQKDKSPRAARATRRATPDTPEIKRPMMLRLNSENSAGKMVNKNFPVDQTPTPTGMMKELSRIFPTGSEQNPFEQDFKKAAAEKEEEKEDEPMEKVNTTTTETTEEVVQVQQEETVPEQSEQTVVEQVPEEVPEAEEIPIAKTETLDHGVEQAVIEQTDTPDQVESQPQGDQTIEEIQTSFDHEETIENVGNEETIGEEDMGDKNNFREPSTPGQQTDTNSQDGNQVVATVGTSNGQPVMITNGSNVVFPNNSFAQNNNIPMLVMGGNQMVQVNGSNVASPVRIVSDQNGGQVHQQQSQQQQQPQQQQTQQNIGQGMILTTAGNGSQTASGQKVVQLIMAQPSGGNPQQARVIAQPQQIVIPTPTSGGGTQMIVNGALNGAVQPFVMQQVMQIQDPNTGQIQTVITQPPQQQYMIQTVTDPNTNSQSSSNQPPAYTQCVMAMPQQVQLLQPQFQVMPNQPMLVNAQGQIIGNGQQQFQIINHGTALPQSGQSGQSVQNLPSGATLVQAAPSQQLPNGSTVLTIQQADKSNDNSSNSSKSRSRTASQQSNDGKSYDKKSGSYSSSRPSYTHRPQLSGLSSVVQLSKEALQAIEQAGNDCGGGKRGGPRLNYEELDPKRRKFLERNRQAAARCRERKKQWIVSLEGRSNELKEDNRRVEEECIRLKTKLEQLRKVLAQQDRNQQVTISAENFRTKQAHIEHTIEAQPMETDSGVDSAELPAGAEIIMTKTEMENDS